MKHIIVYIRLYVFDESENIFRIDNAWKYKN